MSKLAAVIVALIASFATAQDSCCTDEGTAALAGVELAARGCQGGSCNVCSNCRACKWCKSGGTCSACAAPTARPAPAEPIAPDPKPAAPKIVPAAPKPKPVVPATPHAVKVPQPVTELPPPAAEQDGIAVYFSPSGKGAEAVAYHVGKAEKTLDVAAYSITHLKIAKAVKDAHERGVKVRIVIDKAQSAGRYSSATYLVNAGIPVYIDAASGLMHHKIAIIDSAVILTGSFNWTTGADVTNAENLLVLTGKPDLVKSYQVEFERVLLKSKPYEAVKDK